MSLLADFIKEKTPKFNLQLAEGLCYHRLKTAIEYIDAAIKYNVLSKTNTRLKYLGFKELSPKEEIRYIFNKVSKVTYDIAENNFYLVEFYFQYGDNPEVMKYHFYVPYIDKGNTMYLSGTKYLVMPVLADKVVSVGEKIIFINILTAKYSFSRSFFGVVVAGRFHRVPVINTELYKNQSKKLADTTKAHTTVMHYLLANYGYSATMTMLLGFIPRPVYDYDKDDKVIVKSTGVAPHGFIKSKQIYEGCNIQFLVDKDKFDERVAYCLGNVFYVLDNFPQSMSIDELDSTLVWKRLLAEIIHSGNHGLAYLNEKINAHFSDLNSAMDSITVKKLSDVGVTASTLMELLGAIFENFNSWILNSETRSLYHSKTYEVESFVLSKITSQITRMVLDVNKEELRVKERGELLEDKTVRDIFKKYFRPRNIYQIRKQTQHITSVEYPGDHLYPKFTSMVAQQESDFVSQKKQEVNTSEKKKMIASMATVGSILGLSKKNPTPLIRANPYCPVDPVTGTILPHEDLLEIVQETDKLLANMVTVGSDDDDDLSRLFDKETDEALAAGHSAADEIDEDDDLSDDDDDSDTIDMD